MIKRFLRPHWFWGGWLVLAFLFFVYVGALGRLFQGFEAWQGLWDDAYLHHVLWFSFKQAFLSALLSVVLGLLLARAFFYQRFWGKVWVLRFFSLSFVLPSLVVVFGLLAIYGANGWLKRLVEFFGFSFSFRLYGLSGILLAHVFLNAPFAARLFLQCFQAISSEERQLAAQLGLRSWRFVRWVEWGYIRQQLLPVFALIFMLCFSSFTVVLALGGGPRFSSLEVAIYQAVVFDFDLARASFYAFLQFSLYLLLFLFSALMARPVPAEVAALNVWCAPQAFLTRLWQIFMLFLMVFFVLSPLLATAVNALFARSLWAFWQSADLWRAVGFSCAIAFSSALLAVFLACLLLLLARRLEWQGYVRLGNALINGGMLLLAVPSLLLAVGLFVWLQRWVFSLWALFLIVVLCNALMAMPFVLRVLAVPMRLNMKLYERLCQSLGMSSWQRLRLIEWQALAPSLRYAFALAAALSLGDFTAIALFGNQSFSSLPYLLYEQLGSYRGDEAAVTALLLLTFCFALFALAERGRAQEVRL